MPLRISESATVSPLADLENRPGAVIYVGDDAVIDAFVKIRPTIGTGTVTIGRRSQLNSGVMIYTGHGVRLGANVLVAANVVFAPVNHEYGDPDRLIREQGFMESRGGIVVEDDVWVGAGSVILDGAWIRKGAVVGALSLVRGEVAPYTVVAGNPLRLIGARSSGERRGSSSRASSTILPRG